MKKKNCQQINMDIDKTKWDKLIEDHYTSACKRNSSYSEKYSLDEMKEWWYKRIEYHGEEFMEGYIEGVTCANNNKTFFHPV